MAGWKRRILGIMVISAGVCAALPFRNEEFNTPADPSAAVEFPAAATSRNELTLQLMIPSADTGIVSGQHPISVVAETKLTPQPPEVRRDELQAPPSIASAFEPLVATFPVALEQATPKSKPQESERRHRIVDGDTLETLAARYLGNRDQWPSIFEANDGLLTDRDILPIGLEIKIPNVRHSSRAVTDAHLVPVPPGPLTRGKP